MYKAETQNTAIYVDYENIYITLEEQYTGVPDSKLTILDKIREQYRNNAVKTFRLFCDFSTITTIIPELDTRFLDLKHVSSIDRGSRHKNAADIAMAIDITRSLIKRPDIDRYVIVSSDSDMLPIINELVHQGKMVDVVCFKSHSTGEAYQNILSSWGVQCFMIEDMLKLVQFEKITKEIFEQNMYKIKGELARVYGDYKEKNTYKIPSIKDIRQGLEAFGYCKEDSADIIKYSFQYKLIEADENESFGRVFRGIKILP